MYSNNQSFIGTKKQITKTTEDRRIPSYKSAILGVCQLQLKICSKLIELASPSCPTLFDLTTLKPLALKRLAGQSILLHPCEFVGVFCYKPEINDGTLSNNGESHNYQMLPNELIKFLQDGAADYD